MTKTYNQIQIKRNVLRFLVSLVLFLLVALPLRKSMAIAAVSDVRLAAMLNPVLGLAYGWPSAIGCAIANFIADLYSGYGIVVAIVGFVPQVVYGILPYYFWKMFVPAASHRTRLDHPKKVLLFTLVMAVNSVIIGIAVGLMERFLTTGEFLSTATFVAINDFNSCIILGLPVMTVLDFIYSRVRHEGKRKLSVNEKVIIASSMLQLIAFNITIAWMYITDSGSSTIEIWTEIFRYSTILAVGMTALSVLVMFWVRYISKKNAKLKCIENKSGTIFVDNSKKLEFVSMPGRSLKHRVKAEFWGCTDENIRAKNIVANYETAWYTMISNQKGCPMKCVFCDCPAYGFHGNVSRQELNWQIETILKSVDITQTKYFEVDFMRMGEPSFNHDILDFVEHDLRKLVRKHVNADVVLPYISTMLPRANSRVKEFILEYCRIMNDVYDGEAALQFSINTTDEKVRNKIFCNKSLSLAEIAEIAKCMPAPKGRKYALNFAVTRDTVIDASLINELFDKSKFMVKITPIHETFNAVDNGFVITSEYNSFDVYRDFEKRFMELGWDVIVFLDSKEEDDDDLTCGKLLLSNQ